MLWQEKLKLIPLLVDQLINLKNPIKQISLTNCEAYLFYSSDNLKILSTFIPFSVCCKLQHSLAASCSKNNI